MAFDDFENSLIAPTSYALSGVVEVNICDTLVTQLAKYVNRVRDLIINDFKYPCVSSKFLRAYSGEESIYGQLSNVSISELEGMPDHSFSLIIRRLFCIQELAYLFEKIKEPARGLLQTTDFKELVQSLDYHFSINNDEDDFRDIGEYETVDYESWFMEMGYKEKIYPILEDKNFAALYDSLKGLDNQLEAINALYQNISLDICERLNKMESLMTIRRNDKNLILESVNKWINDRIWNLLRKYRVDVVEQERCGEANAQKLLQNAYKKRKQSTLLTSSSFLFDDAKNFDHIIVQAFKLTSIMWPTPKKMSDTVLEYVDVVMEIAVLENIINGKPIPTPFFAIKTNVKNKIEQKEKVRVSIVNPKFSEKQVWQEAKSAMEYVTQINHLALLMYVMISSERIIIKPNAYKRFVDTLCDKKVYKIPDGKTIGNITSNMGHVYREELLDGNILDQEFKAIIVKMQECFPL